MVTEREPRLVQPRLPGMEGSSVYRQHVGIGRPNARKLEEAEVVPETPQEQDYGGYSPKERAELEHDLPYWQK